ncbi:ELM1/GtrOC1 family putative glycosyltransferase [Azotobacter vinelandii]
MRKLLGFHHRSPDSRPQSAASGAAAEGEPPAVPRIVPVVLEARPGAPEAPAVRIFLGTEPAQHRAERIFFYSLERVRDPLRRYEVYRMTGLPGFDRKGWRTNFTNFRFAIPDLAGRQGRAIYTDVDQIFTADPAELFDQPMGEHGYLALLPEDTAVMLIDCERMIRCWTYAKACREPKKALCAEAAAEPGRWGALDPLWHARDFEFRPGETKLLHYTALHLQPWRPTPEQYSYQIHPLAEHFLSLEQAADREGYEIYAATSPSPGFAAGCEQAARLPAEPAADLLRQARALGAGQAALVGAWSAADEPSLPRWSLEQLGRDDLPVQDAVIANGLERLPVEDLPWLLDRLFRLGCQWVFVKAELGAEGSMIGSLDGWRTLVRRVALRYPDRCWQLDCRDRRGRTQRFRADFAQRTGGGRELPRVWVLQGARAGDNAQLTDIAEALGWPYEIKRADASGFALSPPWPDLVLSAGRHTAVVARQIQRQSQGHARLVVLGRPRASLDRFDRVVTTPQYGLPLRGNVVDLPAPFIGEHPLDEATLDAWRQRFAHLPRPWIALLVGGDTIPYRLDERTATTLGREAGAAARTRGGSLLVSTSPRTSADATDALLAAIDAPLWSYRFGSPDDNPYRALLALADAFVVTGESVSMLTEACMTGRPVAVFPLPLQRHRKARLQHALERRLGVIERVAGSRGVPRQQNRLGRLYDEVVAAGWVKRERCVEQVHLALGVAPLPEGLDHPPGLSPALLAASRERALQAIREVVQAERPVS